MPRTAKTLAVTHDGKDVLLSGKTVPLLKQLEAIRKFKGLASHEEYAEVNYQESDGSEQVLRFRSPDKQKEHDDLRAKELAAATKAGAALKEGAKTDETKPSAPAPASEAAPKIVADNEFKREELQTKSQGDLLAIAKTLIDARRIEPPKKTSPTALIEAILAAKPSPAPTA